MHKPFFSSHIASGLLVVLAFLMPLVASADGWIYRGDVDKMTSKERNFAMVASDNVLELRFPYGSKSNYGFLTLRDIGGNVDVMVTIKNGKILCAGEGDSCQITVRFDQAPPVTFKALGSSDHNSTVLFIENTSRFIASVSKANKILIQFKIYNAGNQTLEFSPLTPLVWGTSSESK